MMKLKSLILTLKWRYSNDRDNSEFVDFGAKESREETNMRLIKVDLMAKGATKENK